MKDNETEHYFTKQPVSEEILRDVSLEVNGVSFTFTAGSGVFSKNRIDPGSQLLISCIEADDGDSILDLGCGYGPVGIIAGYFHPTCSITMVDINERAVALAKKNAARNHINNATILQSDGFEKLSGITFDRIYTNPPYRAGKKLILDWVDKSHDVLSEGGSLYIVGRKKQGIKSIETRLTDIYKSVETVSIKGGYRVLKASI